MKLSGENTDTLVERYTVAAAEHGRGTESGDYRKTNKAHDALANIYCILRDREQLHRVTKLLEHEDPNVRLAAATHTLSIVPDRAEQALLDLRDAAHPLTRADARMVLELWKQGKLELP